MKVLKILLLLFPVAGLFLHSCTKIEEPYSTARSANIKDTTMNWDTIKAVRRVLLEDYTGHKCTNCPEAAVSASSLEELYQGKLIVMAVHAGFYAKPDKTGDYTLDLTTTAGQEWNSEFKFQSYPNGMVNRQLYAGSVIVGYNNWGNAVNQIINQPPVFQVKVTNAYDSNYRKLTTTIYNRFLTSLTGKYSLTVCIVEDSIIGAQKNDNPNIGPHPDWYGYVFNGVLRGSINGTNGEVITTEPDLSLTYVGHYQATLDPDMVAKNCWVLAFVSNVATKEIIQTEMRKIIP